MGLSHDSHYCYSRCSPHWLGLEEGNELLLVALWNGSQDLDDLGGGGELVLLGELLLQLGEVDLLVLVVCFDQLAHDLRNALNLVESLITFHHLRKNLISLLKRNQPLLKLFQSDHVVSVGVGLLDYDHLLVFSELERLVHLVQGQEQLLPR
jgi:hypothetical protein